jgi:VanZ family protein
MPLGGLPRLDMSGLDRVLHAAFYAMLAVLVARAVAAYDSGETAAAALTLVGTLAFGALMEWVQGFVERTPDFIDWAADAGGVIVALAARAAWIRPGERSR